MKDLLKVSAQILKDRDYSGIPIALAKICFSNSHKARKNTSVLVGTIWNSHLAFQEIFKVKFSRGFHGILYHEIEKLVNII